jgi:hypothetical protein
MIRDFLDSPLSVIWVILGFSALLWLWVRYRRGYSSGRANALYVLVLCSGYFLLLLFFAIEPSLAPPAEIDGRVSQVYLRYPIGRTGDHSQFDVTSPNGLRVKLDSERHVAETLRTGDTVYVRYDPLTLDPLRVERLDGSTRLLLVDYHPPRWMTISNWAMLPMFAIGIYSGARGLRSDVP